MVCKQIIFHEGKTRKKSQRHKKITKEDVARAVNKWDVNKEVVNNQGC